MMDFVNVHDVVLLFKKRQDLQDRKRQDKNILLILPPQAILQILFFIEMTRLKEKGS